jgi:hypothetical protein
MIVRISNHRPTTKPLREYETRFLYVGLRFRYDTHAKTMSSLERHPNGTITYSEIPSDASIFSRGYYAENTRVIVYSDSPKIWVEETSPHDFFVFVQQPTQEACT